jgi:hypothetical protein
VVSPEREVIVPEERRMPVYRLINDLCRAPQQQGESRDERIRADLFCRSSAPA